MPPIAINSDLGDFTVFGFARNPEFVKQWLPGRLGISPRTIEIGEWGRYFFHTSNGEIAESQESIVLKVGFLRSSTKSPLSADQLLAQKLVEPRSINVNGFSGNALVVALSKTEPTFSAFLTLMALPQLYYAILDDVIICSDVLRCIVNLLPNREMNEVILPHHFLFRSVHGSLTYFRGVERLLHGHQLQWSDGNIETRLLRSLETVSEESKYIRNDEKALNLLSESLQDVVRDYSSQIEGKGQGLANLLSGGVDSTLVQYFINANSSHQPARSISYSIQVPAFEFEIDYARQASHILNTEHTFVNYTPQDYPCLLNKTVDLLAQPPRLETEPSMVAVAAFIQAANWPEKYFFTALAADSVFGMSDSIKLKGLQYIRKIPFAVHLLHAMGRALEPVPTSLSQTLLKGAKIIASENDPDTYISPLNTVLVYVLEQNWDMFRHWFGDKALREALGYRRNLAASYSTSTHYLDKVHFIDLFVGTLEQGAQRRQLFLAHQLDQVDPFCDEDLLYLAFTFSPDMRYIKGFRYKHLLKRLLAQKTGAPVAHLHKGGSTVNDDLVTWMRSGPLRPLVEEIDRPDFIDKKDFDRMINKPDYFLWPLLTLDVFKKRILGA